MLLGASRRRLGLRFRNTVGRCSFNQGTGGCAGWSETILRQRHSLARTETAGEVGAAVRQNIHGGQVGARSILAPACDS